MNKPRKPKARSAEEMLLVDQRFREWFVNLLTIWANAESWFAGIGMTLLQVDAKRASVILGSFNSTRAKVDFVQRVAIMTLADARKIRHLNKLCREFKSVTEMRNRLAHSLYTFRDVKGSGPAGAFDSIEYRNYQRSDFDGTNSSTTRIIDRAFVNEIEHAARRAGQLTKKFERFCKYASSHVLELPRDTPLPLHEIHRPRLRRQRPGKRPKRQRQPQPLLASPEAS